MREKVNMNKKGIVEAGIHRIWTIQEVIYMESLLT